MNEIHFKDGTVVSAYEAVAVFAYFVPKDGWEFLNFALLEPRTQRLCTGFREAGKELALEVSVVDVQDPAELMGRLLTALLRASEAADD